MKQTVKWLAAALIALGLNQAVWAGDVSDFRENLQAAEQGNAAAQFNLGVMYENGQGVRQDYVQAVQWYRKASEQGDAQAQYNLGLMYYDMYYDGRGVRQDLALAQQWLGKACQNGDQNSCDNDQRLKAGY
ncbi:TPA: sel1 repeat family protein [Neisseria gonorrhoeae]